MPSTSAWRIHDAKFESDEHLPALESSRWAGHRQFGYDLVAFIKPKRIVELGTYYGCSFYSFLQAIKDKKLPTESVAIDTWAGDPHGGFYGNEVRDAVRATVDSAYSGCKVRLLQKTFDEALGDVEDGSVDLLHIDGFHSYEAVSHDFETWLPKLRDNGVVLFHDVSPATGFGTIRFWEEIREQHPHFEFLSHSWGLGVLFPKGDKWHRAMTASNPELLKYYVQNWELECVRREQKEALSKQAHPLAQPETPAKTLQAELNAARASGDALQSELDRVLRSRSMRVTAPLRRAHWLVRFGPAILRSRFKVLVLSAINLMPSPWLRRKVLSLARSLQLGTAITSRYQRLLSDSPGNARAHDQLVRYRNLTTLAANAVWREPTNTPALDITAVSYNDARWIERFTDSLLALEYPLNTLSITFRDHGSKDETVTLTGRAAERLRARGVTVRLQQGENLGYGAGHNRAIATGNAPFVLVTNVDVEFEPDALRNLMDVAAGDSPEVAAWELRQAPYEHPKYYDPVSGATNWNSHACVLLRRSAFDAVGGYDESIFMYGEDVELSYRLRRAGHILKYVPRATIRHYSFEDVSTIKPLQFSGSTLANFYLRLRYGTLRDILAAPMLLLGLATHPGVPEELKPLARENLKRAAKLAPRALFSRQRTRAAFPFRRFDFEMTRDGAGVKSLPRQDQPLVSIITRTAKGRDHLLRQACLSVNNQTYNSIEHIVVSDGGGTKDLPAGREGVIRRLVVIPKSGRSVAGNRGLAEARGRWCLFLDDDDILFSDHVEVLVNALLESAAVASYSLAWEVATDYLNADRSAYREISHMTPPVFRVPFSTQALSEHNLFPIQAVLFERRLFLERGGFDEDMEALEDWVLWNKYAVGHDFVMVPKTTSFFRVPADPRDMMARHRLLHAAYDEAKRRIARDGRRFSARTAAE